MLVDTVIEQLASALSSSALRFGYQPKHRTGHDCLAVQTRRDCFALAGPSPDNTAPRSRRTSTWATLPVHCSPCGRTYGGNHPASSSGPSPISDTHQVGSQVARRSSRQAFAVRLGLSPLAAFTPMDHHRRFLRAERGSTRLPIRESRSQFGSFDLARRLDRPLWHAARLCGRRAAHSVWAPTLTGKPSRALERVKLFPVRFSRCQLYKWHTSRIPEGHMTFGMARCRTHESPTQTR